MQLVNLYLDFKTGPKKVELLCANGNACFRRVNDIYHFKAILDTWIALNSKLPDYSYSDQIRHIIPEYDNFPVYTHPYPNPPSDYNSYSNSTNTPLKPSKSKLKKKSKNPTKITRATNPQRSVEKEIKTIKTTFFSNAKNPSHYTPLIFKDEPKRNFDTRQHLNYTADEINLIKNKKIRIDTFYDCNGNIHYTGDVDENNLASGNGT